MTRPSLANAEGRQDLRLMIEVALDDIADLSGWKTGGYRELFKQRAKPILERMVEKAGLPSPTNPDAGAS